MLSGLNDNQKEAVQATEGYIRVIAGAGSGKTLTLTKRYGYLVNEIGVPTSNILCVTFTNKAANEMKKRIRSMIGEEALPYVCTFHSFCVKILREDIHVINYPEKFLILDEEDSLQLLRTVYENMGINTKNITYKDALKEIHKWKSDGSPHVEYFKDLNNDKLSKDISSATENGQTLKSICLRYVYEQKKNFALDFDDLIFVTLAIFEMNEDKKRKWQERLEYIMVDEFQDVSPQQYLLVDILSEYHKNLFIVGDPDQNIYSWRGANVRFILDFDKIHENTNTIILEENYRSTSNILKASNSLIEKNTDRIKKSMFTKNKKDIPVFHNAFKESKDEADYIVAQIKKIKANTGCEYNDFAILYRAHYVSRALEESLLKKDIPYAVYSGVSFYQRAEIKDSLSYLRMLLNKDDISFLRTINNPRRGFGDRKIKFLKNYSESHGCSLYQALLDNIDNPLISKSDAKKYVDLIFKYSDTYTEYKVSDLLDLILKESGYEENLRTLEDNDRLDNLAELKKSICDAEQKENAFLDLATYLQDISLYTNADKQENKNVVKLMTVHAAKGLEWKNVFVFELNERIFPSPRVRKSEDLEEERRLAYVAMTRARELLFLTSSYGFNAYNEPCSPSRFVTDIDKNLIHFETPIQHTCKDLNINFIKDKEAVNDALFKSGDIIFHHAFGQGEIQKVFDADKFYLIKFDIFDNPKRISFSAKLKNVTISTPLREKKDFAIYGNNKKENSRNNHSFLMNFISELE